MTIRKLAGVSALLCALATPTPSQAGNVWLDPGIRHTNGMPIASSEPRRSGSVNWSCNPDKIGYCGGYYYRPCIDSLRLHNLSRAAEGCYGPAGTTYRSYMGTVCPPCEVAGGIEGLEPVGMSTLGEIPNEMLGQGGGGQGQFVPAVPPLGAGRR